MSIVCFLTFTIECVDSTGYCWLCCK